MGRKGGLEKKFRAVKRGARRCGKAVACHGGGYRGGSLYADATSYLRVTGG